MLKLIWKPSHVSVRDQRKSQMENMLLRGGKNSSEFLSSCNEDNLIKIKAKLIKNLKVQVFGCIISLNHGRMGLLSLAEVPGCADR